jgi:hypothetical protein
MIEIKDQDTLEMLQRGNISPYYHIKPGTLREQEMRMATVIMGGKLADEIQPLNIVRGGCSEYLLDFYIWKQARKYCRNIGTKDSLCGSECSYTTICDAMSDPELAKVKLPRVSSNYY